MKEKKARREKKEEKGERETKIEIVTAYDQDDDYSCCYSACLADVYSLLTASSFEFLTHHYSSNEVGYQSDIMSINRPRKKI